MPLPYKLPVRAEKLGTHAHLIGADQELIAELWSASDQELEAIVNAINGAIPEELRVFVEELIEYARNATLESDDEPACIAEIQRILENK